MHGAHSVACDWYLIQIKLKIMVEILQRATVYAVQCIRPAFPDSDVNEACLKVEMREVKAGGHRQIQACNRSPHAHVCRVIFSLRRGLSCPLTQSTGSSGLRVAVS